MTLGPQTRRRPGFTLIELLIVIAIIAILVALTAAGIFYLLGKREDLAARNDITQLSQSLQAFKTKYGVYPPSKIKLCYYLGDYNASAFDQESVAALNRIWPKLSSGVGNFNDGANPGAMGIPWDIGSYPGNAPLPKKTAGRILEGDQCLVFFLGGIPGNGTVNGFANDPINPAVGANRNKSLYDFDLSRLRVRTGATANNSTAFPSYYDAYKQAPYVYFSSNGRANGYDPTQAIADAGHQTLGGQNNPIFFVAPFHEPNTVVKFLNPNSYQIICAGRDGIFLKAAPATYAAIYGWSPSIAPNVPAEGKDDMTNFYDSPIGVFQAAP
jgi:prepilin-type N-terminal cleavage/methylation domain-containing protein